LASLPLYEKLSAEGKENVALRISKGNFGMNEVEDVFTDGRNQITDDNWEFISKKGWYLWAIAAPKALISAMMMVEKHLTHEQKREYLCFFDALRDKPYGVGYNRMDYAMLMIGSAALKKDIKKLVETQLEIEAPFLFSDNNREISIETFLDKERAQYTVTKGQGFYTDGSYVYHTLLALNATYGVSHLEKTVEYLSLVHETTLDVTTPQADNVMFWIKNSFEGLMYQCAMYKCLHGRSKYPDCYDTGRRIVTAYIEALDVLSDEDAAYVKRLIKYHVQSVPFVNFYSSLKIAYIGKLREIMNDDAIEPIDEICLSKSYHHMDKFSHKRDDWSVCISMSSARMFNYESICNEGQRNWYVSDGMTEYYVKGNYQNGSLNYWNYVNYQKLPGTTVDTQQRKAVSIHQGNEYLSTRHFVGGATLCDTYGVAAMDLESYHNDEDFGIDAGILYGGKAPKHKCDLTAKKAWFMFDHEIVCLGVDINASDNNNAEVITVVDNCMLQDNNFNYDQAEGWAHLDGACGYYFPTSQTLLTRVCKNEYSGWEEGEKCWGLAEKPSFLELWFSHGINPERGIMRTNFEQIPESLEESATIDGANDIIVLFKIILPLSVPVIAVMVLFYGVAHWNSWFNALLYIRDRNKYPLQLVLRGILLLNSTDSMMESGAGTDKFAIGESLKYATIVVATLPILCIYPMIQKYFVKGIMIGAVKG